MDGLETLSEALERLSEKGYEESLHAENGRLGWSPEHAYEPSEFKVEEVVRFEGVTDLNEESAVFALSHKSGTKGLYIVAYGPEMDTDDMLVVQKLRTSNHV